jgi:N-acylglucosamine-6-phosphate 2-epimerase
MTRKLEKGLIVSCQALPDEPLFGGRIMEKMAYAAMLGGANGIRSNGIRDINGIAKKIGRSLPIIGLLKVSYPDSAVYITPTAREAKRLIASSCDIIALDATSRKRPHGEKLEDLVAYLRQHTDKPLMADIATEEDILASDRLGFDYISTTLRGYTEDTEKCLIPDLPFLEAITKLPLKASLVAEGGIKDLSDVRKILSFGFEYVVIGGAITRPLLITEYYKTAFPKTE